MLGKSFIYDDVERSCFLYLSVSQDATSYVYLHRRRLSEPDYIGIMPATSRSLRLKGFGVGASGQDLGFAIQEMK